MNFILQSLKAVYKTFFTTDKRFPIEYFRFNTADYFSRMIYSKYLFSEYGRAWLDDENFIKWYRSYPENNHSADRKYFMKNLLLLTEHIEGDTSECGVYRGSSSELICFQIDGTGKQHHIFDSFEGVSKPDQNDGAYWEEGVFNDSSEDIVKKNLAAFNFVHLYKGWIPIRFNEVADKKFSFVHIDVDLYKPTLDSIAFFYPILQKGGIILLDDYGFHSCPGAKKAVDDFMADKPEKIINVPTGQAFIIKQ